MELSLTENKSNQIISLQNAPISNTLSGSFPINLKVYETNKQIRELCDFSENEECVSYILENLKTELDLKTIRMLLKFIRQIKTLFVSNGKELSKAELADILKIALVDPDYRKKCMEFCGSDSKVTAPCPRLE